MASDKPLQKGSCTGAFAIRLIAWPLSILLVNNRTTWEWEEKSFMASHRPHPPYRRKKAYKPATPRPSPGSLAVTVATPQPLNRPTVQCAPITSGRLPSPCPNPSPFWFPSPATICPERLSQLFLYFCYFPFIFYQLSSLTIAALCPFFFFFSYFSLIWQIILQHFLLITLQLL